jgi:hypothetical protein
MPFRIGDLAPDREPVYAEAAITEVRGELV